MTSTEEYMQEKKQNIMTPFCSTRIEFPALPGLKGDIHGIKFPAKGHPLVRSCKFCVFGPLSPPISPIVTIK